MNTRKLISIIKKINLELLIWCGALVYLFISHGNEILQFTVCPLKLAGFEHCPGCGLGASVSHLMHGHWQESLLAHPLGAFALAVIVFRIFTLIKNNYGSSIKIFTGDQRRRTTVYSRNHEGNVG